jgi:hypothetical protein
MTRTIGIAMANRSTDAATRFGGTGSLTGYSAAFAADRGGYGHHHFLPFLPGLLFRCPTPDC